MASRVCVCPPKVPFCQIFSGGGSAGARERGSLEERAGRRAPGVNWGGGRTLGIAEVRPPPGESRSSWKAGRGASRGCGRLPWRGPREGTSAEEP